MKRVVVTGMGTINPLGKDVSEFWNNSLLGKSNVSPITRFDASKFRTQIASEIKDFHPEKYLDKNEIKRSVRDREEWKPSKMRLKIMYREIMFRVSVLS